MSERADRPDLEGYRASIVECCGDQVGERFCDGFGCSSTAELIAYALQLEQDAAGARAIADQYRQEVGKLRRAIDAAWARTQATLAADTEGGQ